VGDPLADLDATAQAELVRSGEVTPLELADAAIARIEALNGELNAVVLPRFDRAREEASAHDLPDGPFRGVPFLTKDLYCGTAGEPETGGMRFLKDAGWRALSTSNLARRFRHAGLVNLGRTNSPELGLLPTTEPEAWGPTRNPWDPTRTPGGSSGGSAAAVAAGIVPCAHASDGGGSIRIPASACGLFGLKPSRGRVSLGPTGGELTNILSVQFVLARSVRDTAALLDACTGAEPGDPVIAPAAPHPYADAARSDPGRLRVGMLTRAFGDAAPVDRECETAVENAARLLESLGHAIEPAHPAAFDEPDRGVWFGIIWGMNTYRALDAYGTGVGRAVTEDDVEPGTWAMADVGRGVTALEYMATVDRIQTWARDAARWWHQDGDAFDLLLTPTMAEPPVPLGTFASTRDDPWTGSLRAGAFVPFTPTINLTGQPAMSVPLHETPDGLPVGVHLVAEYGREDLLLSLAGQLEQAAPWSARRPAIYA
jgi:amidase